MKLFGTDGIRGKANVYPLVGDLTYKLGQALVYALNGNKNKQKKIIIGKDTRLSGYMLESALTSGVVSMGADAYLVGPMPTPAIAFLVRSMRADAGVVISASHNPYDDNGIKIFSEKGLKLDENIEELIEDYIFNEELEKKGVTGENIGRAYRIRDTLGRYIVFAKDAIPYTMNLEGLRIVIDCANGATYKVAPMIFEELGADVIAINNKPNGININEKCGSTYPSAIIEAAKLYRADVGIAFDGDGDRVYMVDDKYQLIDGDMILAILANDMKKENTLKNNTVVGTVMTNYGLEQFLDNLDIKLERVNVGDKHIARKMLDGGFNLGGEQSGHVILSDLNTTGDGIITALAVLSIIKKDNKPLSYLHKNYIKTPEKTLNVTVKNKPPIEDIKEMQDAIQRAKNLINNRGRVVVRYSGTEPLLRITVEAENYSKIDRCIEIIKNAAMKSLNQ
jgi:phosphoglucosamine mutase